MENSLTHLKQMAMHDSFRIVIGGFDVPDAAFKIYWLIDANHPRSTVRSVAN